MKKGNKEMSTMLARCGYGLAAVLATCAMSSCSDDTVESLSATSAALSTESVTIITDQSELSARVTNFADAGTRATLATGETSASAALTMPDEPSIPDGATKMTSDNTSGYWCPKAGDYYVAEGETVTIGGADASGSTIYVAGELIFQSSTGTPTVIVLSTGKLDTGRSNAGGLNFDLYDYSGTFAVESSDYALNGTTLMTTGDLSVSGEFRNSGGCLYVAGDVNVGSLTSTATWIWDSEAGQNVYKEPTIRIDGTVTATDKVSLSGTSAYLYDVTTPEMYLATSTDLTVACKCIVSTFLQINNECVLRSEGYIESPKTEMNSNAQLEVASGTWASLGELTVVNSAVIKVVGDEYGVVKAGTITVQTGDLRSTFLGYMGLHLDQWGGYKGGVEIGSDEIELLSQILVNDEDNTNIKETECHPAFGSGDVDPDPTEPVVIIEHVGEVTPDTDHTHDISATCVYMIGDMAYVSYHQQGTGYSGCLEAISVDKTTPAITLEAFMRSETDRDYNHLIVYDNTVYAVGGDTHKGAVITTIGLDGNGIFNSSEVDDSTALGFTAMMKVDGNSIGHDGNCIVRKGDYFITSAAAGGFETFYDDLTEKSRSENWTAGSAKFIHSDGSKMVTLNLADEDDTQSMAVINVYNDDDYDLASPLLTFSNDYITPVDGKNVCKIDGDNIYACLGQTGFKRYSATTGAETGSFIIEGTKSAVNGMTYDDNYIYIAYGSEGVYVLDKTTLEKVASYTWSGGKSANYVEVLDGYIFVAYGRSGFQVFKLSEM